MNKINNKESAIEAYKLMERLFPICRSITGDGNRKTLKILKEYIPIKICEEPSGKKVFDWTIPQEWNIKDAYIKNSNGVRIVDFQKNNLHLVGYSEPFNGKMSLENLNKYLFSLPGQPDVIPYITSYYERRWGFCLSENDRKKLEEDEYEIKVDSSFKKGSLTYGELIIKGEVEEEILISTYICHPSMANNELSGPVVSTFLAKHLLDHKKPYYTYRFIFIPETIGSIVYLSKHYKDLISKTKAGYVVTCIGDNGDFSYLKTKDENQLVDRATIHILKHSGVRYKIYDYLYRGSDERQYNAPGINLPIGSLMRSKYGEYSEYHTSADNMNLISIDSLHSSLEMYKNSLDCIEKNHTYKVTVLCEPQLGKRGLYPNVSTKYALEKVTDMMNLLAYCDGSKDLLWIAEKIDKPIKYLDKIVKRLLKENLLERCFVNVS